MKNILLLLLLPLFSFSQTLSERDIIKSKSNPEKIESLRTYYLDYFRNQNLLIEKYKSDHPTIDFTKFSLQRIIDNNPIFFDIDNSTSVSTVRANSVYPGGSLGLSITGEGIYAGVWDGGKVRSTHQEFSGRVFLDDAAATLVAHGTHVTGTIIGQGVTASRRGFAYQAFARCYDWTNDANEMISFANNGFLVSNHSYGNIASTLQEFYFGNYNSQSIEVDNIMNAFPYYQVVKSAGNDNGNTSLTQYLAKGGYDLISGVSTAKNVLTVAAVEHVGVYNDANSVNIASFSNWGPTDDGRIKPDISAKGVSIFSANSISDSSYYQSSGTSMAAPAITGSIVLLQKHYNNLTPENYMKSATVRGLLCHSTREAGLNPGPDYVFGWGLADVLNAANVLSGKGNTSIVDELNLQQSQVYTRTITINTIQDIKATIAWTDPTGVSNGNGIIDDRTPRLINNLDLKILKDGTIFYPWKLDPDSPSQEASNNSDNNVDNIERVEIFNAQPGTYTIQVTHKGTLQNGNQDFSIIANSTNGLVLNNNDFIVDNDFFIYPNPAEETLYFSNINNVTLSKISVIDISGKLVIDSNDNLTAIDVSNLQSGVYFVKFTTENKTLVKKFIKN